MAQCLRAVVGSVDKSTDDYQRATRDHRTGAPRRDVGNPRSLREEAALSPSLSVVQTCEMGAPAKLGTHSTFRASDFWKPSPRRCGSSLTTKRPGNQLGSSLAEPPSAGPRSLGTRG